MASLFHKCVECLNKKIGRERVLGMKVEEVKRKTKMRWRERRETKPKTGSLFGGSFYRYLYLCRVDFGHFHMVVESLNRGLT